MFAGSNWTAGSSKNNPTYMGINNVIEVMVMPWKVALSVLVFQTKGVHLGYEYVIKPHGFS